MDFGRSPGRIRRHRPCARPRSTDAPCPADQRNPESQSQLIGRKDIGTAFDREFDVKPIAHCASLNVRRDILQVEYATARIGEAVPPRHFIGKPMNANWPLPSGASRLHRLSMWVMSRTGFGE